MNPARRFRVTVLILSVGLALVFGEVVLWAGMLVLMADFSVGWFFWLRWLWDRRRAVTKGNHGSSGKESGSQVPSSESVKRRAAEVKRRIGVEALRDRTPDHRFPRR